MIDEKLRWNPIHTAASHVIDAATAKAATSVSMLELPSTHPDNWPADAGQPGCAHPALPHVPAAVTHLRSRRCRCELSPPRSTGNRRSSQLQVAGGADR